MSFRPPLIMSLLGALLLAACAQVEPVPPSATPTEPRVDFSGYWEKDFRLSDDFANKYNLYLFDVRRRLSSPAQGEISFGGAAPSGDAILGLARFTEELTRGTRLEIKQDGDRVDVAREGDFSLRCAGFGDAAVSNSNAFGHERCGWNGDQLLFRHDLEGLTIVYQLTLAPGGGQLNLTTTVSSAAVANALVISTYFRRYEPGEEGYDCQLTLSRQRVCRQAESPTRVR